MNQTTSFGSAEVRAHAMVHTISAPSVSCACSSPSVAACQVRHEQRAYHSPYSTSPRHVRRLVDGVLATVLQTGPPVRG